MIFENPDMVVFWLVVLARFLVPLTIPRYPLPGIIAALIIDAVDQTVFQVFTNLNLEGYQNYDKALDIYYLTVAYISTMRNWTNLFAIKVAKFLWYYRLFGVTLFELTYSGEGPRYLLLVFPNTFEYFFIFYEAIATKWNPIKLTKKAVIAAAAGIWIFIKLPQEYWIHVAQMDTTDFIKSKIFGVSPDSTWTAAISNKPFVAGLALVGIGIITFVIIKLIKMLPPPDWAFTVDKNQQLMNSKELQEEDLTKVKTKPKYKISDGLIEKIVLITFVSLIFSQIMDLRVTLLQLSVGIGFVIILNAVISSLINTRKELWSMFKEFYIMIVVNLGLVIIYSILLPNFDQKLDVGNTMFYVLLLTMIITLFDRYRKIYEMRFGIS